MADEARTVRGRRSWAAMLVGALLAIIGLILAIGGAWLLGLGGSP